MVAMLGWIIPAPLATPNSVAVRPRRVIVSQAIFLRVSVVRIELAKASKFSGPAFAMTDRFGTAAVIFAIGSGTPMIPVDEGEMRRASISSDCASWPQMLFA